MDSPQSIPLEVGEKRKTILANLEKIRSRIYEQDRLLREAGIPYTQRVEKKATELKVLQELVDKYKTISPIDLLAILEL